MNSIFDMIEFLKKPILPLIFTFLILGCKEEIQKTRPEQYFTSSQEESILKQIVKKTAKKPEGLSSESDIEAYYNLQTKHYIWHFTHEKNGGFYYFMSRPAPSLYGKRSGLGGYFKTTDRLNINGLKEIFITFKMKPDNLLKKGSILFEKMVNQENLESYYPGKIKDEEWIEFPDALNYYDSTSQSWKMRNL